VGRFCATESCRKGINEKGQPYTFHTPLRLAIYPQFGSVDGLMTAWVCDVCGYDSSVESFRTSPEFSYAAHLKRISENG
jgi:hypothetical protein